MVPARLSQFQGRPDFSGISIGIKIFGIATSLLGLMLLVVAFSTHRLRQVNNEIKVLADYTIPITDRVARIDIHALEQELLFERVQTLYQMEPLNQQQIQAEIKEFERFGQLVDDEIAAAINLAQTPAINRADWHHIQPQLAIIESTHQQFHDYAVELFELLARGNLDTVRQRESQLRTEGTDFNQSINDIFLELEALTVQATKSGQQHQQFVQDLSLLVAASATMFGLGYASLVTLGLVQPLRSLTQGTAAVQAGNLDIQLDITSHDEIGKLALAFNAMTQELKLKARLEQTFGKYVDPRIVRSLMADTSNTLTTGERQVMTVGFANVTGLDAIIETLSPDDQLAFINQYLSLMSVPIHTYDGVIDKFINTTIMGFWGPPFTAADRHPQLACETALAQIEQLKKLTIPRTTAQTIPLRLHIGLATGPLVVGNMGSTAAKSYTVMGDTVNISARLKGVSKQYGVTVVITEAIQQQVADTMATRELDFIQVVGKEDPIKIYELIGHKEHFLTETIEDLKTFAAGLAAYRKQDWMTAKKQLFAYLSNNPEDYPSQLLLTRIEKFKKRPPKPDWHGIWQLTKK